MGTDNEINKLALRILDAAKNSTDIDVVLTAAMYATVTLFRSAGIPEDFAQTYMKEVYADTVQMGLGPDDEEPKVLN